MDQNSAAQINISNVGATATGIAHEKASMMKQYFDVVRQYAPTGNTPYLDRVFSLPSFTPSPARDTTSRTSDLYRVGTSTPAPLYFVQNSTSSGYQAPKSFYAPPF